MMKNKKGFTLVELLATITIMGLITVMVTPSIVKLQNNNKTKQFEMYAKSLVEAAKVYVQKEGEDITPLGVDAWQGCIEISYQELASSDLVKSYDDKDYDCSGSKIRYTKTKSSGKYTYHLVCNSKVSKKKNYDLNTIPNAACSVESLSCTPGENAVTKITSKANSESLDYNSANATQKKEVWTYSKSATTQLKANTEYRYIGQNPNNYIKFNNEIWRIIGVFESDDGTGKYEKRLKIVRNESIGNYSWDNKDTTTGAETTYGKNNWSDARLNYLLNPNHDGETGGSLYWNRKSGTCYRGQNNATEACDFTSTGLTDQARALVGNAKWYLGGSSSFNDVTPLLYYQRERGTDVYSGRSTNWTGKVGLIYPSDYGFATSGGSTTNRASCLGKEIYNWDSSSYSDCKNNDWLFNSNYSWTLTSYSARSESGLIIRPTAYIGYYLIYSPDVGVRPTVYLKSSVAFSDGDGSSSSPYIIDDCEE